LGRKARAIGSTYEVDLIAKYANDLLTGAVEREHDQ